MLKLALFFLVVSLVAAPCFSSLLWASLPGRVRIWFWARYCDLPLPTAPPRLAPGAALFDYGKANLALGCRGGPPPQEAGNARREPREGGGNFGSAGAPGHADASRRMQPFDQNCIIDRSSGDAGRKASGSPSPKPRHPPRLPVRPARKAGAGIAQQIRCGATRVARRWAAAQVRAAAPPPGRPTRTALPVRYPRQVPARPAP